MRELHAPVAAVMLALFALSPSPARAEDDPDAEIAARHVEQGGKLFAAGKWQKAMGEYEAAQLVKPNLANDLAIGRCLEKLGRAKEAFKVYLRVLDATNDPELEAEARKRIKEMKSVEEKQAESQNPHLDRGHKLFDGKQYEKALAEFEAARFVKPPPPGIDRDIAKCLDRLERYREAIAAYQKWLDTKPDPFEAETVQQRVNVLTERVRLLDARAGKEPPPSEKPADARPAEPKASEAKPASTGPDPFATKPAEGKLPKDEAAQAKPAEPPPEEPPPAAPAPFWKKHLIPLAVGAGAVVFEGIGLILALSVAPSFVDLANSCAPSCDPATWSGLQARANAGYTMMVIGGLAAVADVALWVWELKLKKEPPRAWLLPSLGGLVAGGRF